MGECKKDVNPLLMHWSYVFLALTHRHDVVIIMISYESYIGVWYKDHNINGLVQERRNSIANALELCLSCTNTSICCVIFAWYYAWFWFVEKSAM